MSDQAGAHNILSYLQQTTKCRFSCLIKTTVLTAHRENLLGITGKDFTLIVASKAAMRGATILKANDDKTRQLNKNTLMAYSGEAGDTGKIQPRMT